MNYFILVTIPILFIIETLCSEKVTTVAFIIVSSFVLYVWREKREWVLYVLGVILGTLCEVVLGFIARHQYWTEHTLFGVPLWLPIAWGLIFVVIRRFGNMIVSNK
jgi:hypothetical protein